jgi:hypothetical protein
MRKPMPICSAVAALMIASVLSGCGGTSDEPTAASGAAQPGSAAQTTESAAAQAGKATEAPTVAQAKIAADAKAAAVAKAATAAKAGAAAAKAKAAAVAPPVLATLSATCPKVEKAVSGFRARSFSPTAPELDAALAQLKLLSGAGDTQTRNALGALLAALPGYRDENPAGVANESRRAFQDSLANLADRCEAVGSSALKWVG